MIKSNIIKNINSNHKIYDFMKWNYIAFSISLFLIILSIIIFLIYGFNLGLDFTGGSIIELHLHKKINPDFIQNILKKNKFTDLIIQNFGNIYDFIIRIPSTNNIFNSEINSQIIDIIKNSIDKNAIIKRIDHIGPNVGIELIQNGSIALLIALFFIFIYIMFRFEWRIALGIIFSLIHDLIITLGILSLFYIEIDLTIIASLMSVIGYSLNDSIVVSDRIRENLYKINNTPYNILNISLTQILNRTLITSSITLLIVLILYIFGGTMLHGFSLVMLIGIFVGTISSIYISSALILKFGIQCKYIITKKNKKNIFIN
ncbi:Protein translocase subunit SecF [Serratia symbiotica]|nr:Protein translocase subunit SecF [Serratia symbiotica]